MSETTKIAVDVLGGDYGAPVVTEGIELALSEDPQLVVLACGPAEAVEPLAARNSRVEAVVTTEEIAMHEHPAKAVRSKKDSSLVVGCRMVKEGRAQGFFSAGSTGACLAAGTLVVGRIKGVARPAICTVVPAPSKPVVMCDVGANADCKPEYLVQFAQMASIYAEKIIAIENPSVALLNIGEEDTKGSQFAQQTFGLLKETVPNFVGNAEGGDILAANYDVFVTDGFTGNVCLKTIEGTSKMLFRELKKVFMSSAMSKVGAITLKKGLSELKDSIDADKYGGAPLLGVKGALIVGHGSSSPEAVKNGIHVAAKTVRSDVSGLIAQTVGSQAIDE